MHIGIGGAVLIIGFLFLMIFSPGFRYTVLFVMFVIGILAIVGMVNTENENKAAAKAEAAKIGIVKLEPKSRFDCIFSPKDDDCHARFDPKR